MFDNFLPVHFRFLVALPYGHLKLGKLPKTRSIHMVTLDLYLHATPLFSPYIMNSLHNGFMALVVISKPT